MVKGLTIRMNNKKAKVIGMKNRHHLFNSSNSVIDFLLHNFKLKHGVGAVFINSIDKDKFYYFDTQKTFFCRLCENGKSTSLAKLCDQDHCKRGFSVNRSLTTELCHLGLSNVAFPIEVDGEIIATLLIGQCKVTGSEEVSEAKFDGFIENAGLSEDQVSRLKSSFTSVKIVSDDLFLNTIIPEGKFLSELLRLLLTEEQSSKIRMSSIAHELSLPMQSIIIDAETLRDEAHEGDRTVDLDFMINNASSILSEVNKLNMHINNLRRVVRFSATDRFHDFQFINIQPMLDVAMTAFTHEAYQKGITIKKPTFTQKKFPNLHIVKEELAIALNNIYSNAIKYSYSKNKHIMERTVTTECYVESKNYVQYFVVEVSNFGVPIEEDEIDGDLIFKAGYRSEYSRDRNRAGSGVGLFLVKDIIERIHQGRVDIYSKPRRSGNLTTLKISLLYTGEENE